MKKLLLLLAVVVIGHNTAFGQNKIDSYYLSLRDKSYEIMSTDAKNGKFSLSIYVPAEHDFTVAMIDLQSKHIPEFKDFLQKSRDKFAEWAATAKENDVKDFSKSLELKSPSVSVYWRSSQLWSAHFQKFEPRFIVLADGTPILSLFKKVTSGTNKFINEKIFLTFSNVEEIDSLIAILDEKSILEKISSANKEKNLFKP